jgi:hypothetical protein
MIIYDYDVHVLGVTRSFIMTRKIAVFPPGEKLQAATGRKR